MHINIDNAYYCIKLKDQHDKTLKMPRISLELTTLKHQ